MQRKQPSDLCAASGIKSWPRSERPREKLLSEGEHRLSRGELLAILLRTGVKGQSALELARCILSVFGSFRAMSHADISRWREIKGLGDAKIAQIKAAIEIGRRFREEDLEEAPCRISASADIAGLLMPRLRDLKKEVFKIALLDSRNRVRELVEVTAGTVNQAYPIVREIFHHALQHHAAAIICVHNHPSGNPAPSPEDKAFTQRLTTAGDTMQIPMLDHIIIGDNEYFSFADAGLLQAKGTVPV